LSRLWLIFGLLLGAVMLGVVGRRVDVGQVTAVLRGLDLGYALLAVLASLSFLYVKAWRWTLLLSPMRQTRVRDLLRAVCAGTAANLIVPHAGEFTRVLMVGGRQPIPASALLASIVIERLFDFAAVLFFLGAVALASSGLPAALVPASLVAAGLFFGLLLIAAFVVYQSKLALRMLDLVVKPLPPRLAIFLQTHAASGIAGLSSLRSAHVLLKVMLVSLVMWSTIVLLTWFSVLATGQPIPVTAAVAVMALLIAALTLPAAPVYVGTTQLAFTMGLAAFGMGPAPAFAASIVYTLFGLLPMLAAGGIYFFRHRNGGNSIAHAG
jgi:uncharacterized protein (TIRG00374 family)